MERLLFEALDASGEGKRATIRALCRTCEAAQIALCQHLDKEEEQVLPLLRSHFSVKEQVPSQGLPRAERAPAPEGARLRRLSSSVSSRRKKFWGRPLASVTCRKWVRGLYVGNIRIERGSTNSRIDVCSYYQV